MWSEQICNMDNNATMWSEQICNMDNNATMWSEQNMQHG